MPGIFAISDIHLPIEIQIKKFKYPHDYFEQVKDHLHKFEPDVLLNAGDFSYESNFKRGLSIINTFKFLPGPKKIFIEGNHDTFLHEEKQKDLMQQLFNNENCYYISGRALIIDLESENDSDLKVGICGAMGWMINDQINTQEDLIIFNNELERLRDSLNQLETLREDNISEKNICLLHHPPTYSIYTDRRRGDESFFNLIREYNFIDIVIYGHIHVEQNFKIYKKVSGIDLYCAAIDQLGFKAIKIRI